MKMQSYLAVWIAAVGLAAPCAFSQGPRARTVTVQSSGTSYLGIGVADIPADRAKALNLKEARGAEVTHVDENGPAAKVGIKQGDVVLEYNGAPIEGVQQLVRMVHETPAGRSVKLVIWRNGAAQTLTATVGERQGPVIETPGGVVQIPQLPNLPNIPSVEIPRFQWEWQNAMLGIEGESLEPEPQFAEFFGVKDGVLVKQVIRNSPAEKAGFKAGDVIIKVNGTTVGSTRDITVQLRSSARSGQTVTLTVVRDKHEIPLTVNLDQTGGNPNPPEPPAEPF